MRKMNIKTAYIFRIALILICAILVSTYFIASLYAKYTSKGDTDDKAEVSSFNVEVSGTLTETIILPPLKPGDSFTRAIEIVSDSEVGVRYTISVTTTGNLPLTLNWTEITGIIAPNNDTPVSYTLTAEWAESLKDYTLSGRVDTINVTVVCEQIG